MSNGLLEEIHMVKNHSLKTRRIYSDAVKKYTEFCSMTLEELIEEAEFEEDQGIKWKKRKLKRRLLSFRQFLLERYSLNAVLSVFRPIIAIYKYYEIELFSLPPINKKNVRTAEPILFKDLPDKEVIRKAIAIATPVMAAVIYFMASSGCARQETLNLTIGDYIDALNEYTTKTDIYEVLNELKDVENVVPTFKILRQKTDKYYTTYCSPEAVESINSYLLSRKEPLRNESPLFKIEINYLAFKFTQINNELGLGKVGSFNRFRSHMLRKFHASALYNDGMSLDNVNDLQGKAKNKTDQSYFMINPEDLKYEYIKHLPAVTINHDVEKLSIKSPEFLQMENENKELKSEVGDMRKELDEMKELKKEFYGILQKAKERSNVQ
ncbi:tyrosine-type recombinase/integrase [uncultured Methanobrevibacter sp.]|uniref:tyrosine-type recombinase/integrase n=1 Tax=uncultured Methanobrevibacter sp. TaxID=253161 RepID=UPI0025ED7B35|nr:site-specific integrase [uncultured Methanobrevibacter sp.]